MNVIAEAENLISKMSRAEKAQLLQWVVRDLGDAFPGIESTPNVSGGRAVYYSNANSGLGFGASTPFRSR